MDTQESRLLSEQLSHTLDRVNGRIDMLEARLAHQEEVAGLRLSALEHDRDDQEARLRAAAEAVARLTTTASLAQIAQAAFALILSAIAAYLGRR
jgi:uncharacterized coiled-coil protein SlyX